MLSLLNRSTLAILLAPGFAAGLFSLWDYYLRPATGGSFTPLYFTVGYILGLPASVLLLLNLRDKNRTDLRHFAYAGLQAGAAIAVIMGVIGIIWVQAAAGMLIIGPVVGVMVWFMCEWQSCRDQDNTSAG